MPDRNITQSNRVVANVKSIKTDIMRQCKIPDRIITQSNCVVANVKSI